MLVLYGEVTGLPLWRDNGTYQIWKEIRSVHKSDISKDLNHWEQISDDYNPRGDFRIFFNTFERDWYSSPKDLGEGEEYGTIIYLEGRMKYNDNWYAFDPSYSVEKMDINNIYLNWMRNFENSKGYIKVWRVEL